MVGYYKSGFAGLSPRTREVLLETGQRVQHVGTIPAHAGGTPL